MIFRQCMSFGPLVLLVVAACPGQAVDQSATSTSVENYSTSVSLVGTASALDISRQDASILPPGLTGAIGSLISSRKDLQNGGFTSPTPSRGTFGHTGRVWLSTPLVNRAAESSLLKPTGGTTAPSAGGTISPDSNSRGANVSAEPSSVSLQVNSGGGAKTGGFGSQKSWIESPHSPASDSKVGMSKHANRPSPKKSRPPKKQSVTQAGMLP